MASCAKPDDAVAFPRMTRAWPAPHQPKGVSPVGMEMTALVQSVQRDIVETLSALDGKSFFLDNWTTPQNPNRAGITYGGISFQCL